MTLSLNSVDSLSSCASESARPCDPDVLAPALLQKLHVVIAGNAHGRASLDHAHCKPQDFDDFGATINEVTKKDGLSTFWCCDPVIAAFVLNGENALGTARFQFRCNLREPNVMKAKRRFDGLLLLFLGFLFGIGIKRLALREPCQCVSHELAKPSEIPIYDGFPLWMRLQPPFAMTQQLLDLILSDPVMLVGIENRDQNIKMHEQVVQRDVAADLDRVVRPFAPLGELFVERVMLGAYRVSQRLEQAVQKLLAAVAQIGSRRLGIRDRQE